ncbi:MAG: NADH-quinone oxidoreductase subunit N [Melioribacteraceae bacterium]|nr:NADH-quinone oxidoreductase subunit N [Melioribacteraceae bacterium]
MPTTNNDWILILPEIILASGIVFSVLFEIFSKKGKELLPWFSILLFFVVALLSIININDNFILFSGMMEVGGKSAIFNAIFNIGASLVVLNSIDYLKKYGANFNEYYILIQSSVLGMMVMASARDILLVFMGLELMSICFYVLAGINRKKNSSNEASMKYFLLGAFATGFIVYGIALIYGTTGSTSLQNISQNFLTYSTNILFILGSILVLIGFSFKIAAVPFHMWVPDVYQGSATTVTGLMSTTGKTAAFSVLIILLTAIYSLELKNVFAPYFSAIAVLSMFVGSIVALSQNNIKRMLAYSSIAHAGYMIVGLAAGNILGISGIIFYLTAYTFMNLGAFGIISMIERENDLGTEINDYTGLGNRSPILAALMSLFMFGLAGIPPMAGFFGKYYVFIGAIKANLTWLAILGVLSSVISVYFYLRIVVLIYFKESPDKSKIDYSIAGLISVVISAFLVLLFGFFPDSIMKIITPFVK